MRRLAIAVAILLWLGSSPAGAQDDPLTRGVALREAGRDAEAVLAFEEAVRADGGARALAQLALAEQATGAWIEAATHLDEALERVDDPWVADHRAVLEEARSTIAEHVGRLDVLVEPEGAEVVVDGRALGPAPVRGARVLAGEVVVEVRAQDHVTIQRTEQVDASLLTRVRVTLVPVAVPEPEREPVRAAEPPTEPPLETAQPPPIDLTGLHVAAVATGGFALLSVIGLTVSLGLRESFAQTYNGCPPRMSMTCPDELDAARSAELGAGVLGAAAGAGVLAAATFTLVALLLEPEDR